MRVSFLSLLVVLLAAGCGKEPVAEYNSLPVQVLHDYFTAAAAGKHEAAVVQLKKLEDLAPGQPFVIEAQRYEQLRSALEQINVALQRGALAEARRALSLVLTQAGTSPELVECDGVISALTAVAAYRAQQPFKNMTVASQALAAVQARRNALSASPAFMTWLKEQERAVAQLRREELERQVSRFLADYDLVALNSGAGADVVGKRVRDFPEDTPVLPLLDALFGGKGGWLGLARKEAYWQQSLGRYALEVGLFSRWSDVPADLRTRWRTELTVREPVSLCGLALAARVAADAGDFEAAAGWAQDLARRTDIPRPLMAEGARRLLLPAGKFKAAVWLTPCPTLTDYFKRFAQITDTAPTP